MGDAEPLSTAVKSNKLIVLVMKWCCPKGGVITIVIERLAKPTDPNCEAAVSYYIIYTTIDNWP
jgi:hypothetical protein